MSLKKLPTNSGFAIHQILVPSLGKKLRFRPFLVKESKALMIAQGSNDPDQILDTCRSVIESCCVESDGIDGDRLATFDFEWLLVKLRAISVDDKISVEVECDDPHEGRDPATRKTQVLLDLDDIEIVDLDKYKSTIDLGNNLVVTMKAPTIETIKNLPTGDSVDDAIDRIAMQIDKIYDNEEVFDLTEYSKEEIVDWITNLTEAQFDTLFGYFSTIPYCRINIQWTCPVCGKTNRRSIEGMSHFF